MKALQALQIMNYGPQLTYQESLLSTASAVVKFVSMSLKTKMWLPAADLCAAAVAEC